MACSIAGLMNRRIGGLSLQSAVRALGGTFAAAAIGRVLVLAMTIVLARRLGPSNYGSFAFATGVAFIVAHSGSLGWPTLVSRYIPQFIVHADWSRFRGMNRAADRVVLAGTCLLSAILAGVGLVVERYQPSLSFGLLFGALLAPVTAYRLLRRQQLAAIGRAPSGLVLDEATVPLFVLMIVLPFGLHTTSSVYLVFIAGNLLSVLITRFYYGYRLPVQAKSAPPTVDYRAWFTVSLPMLFSVITQVLLNRIDTVMLAPMSNMYEVGLYNAAMRISFVMTFFSVAMQHVIRPKLSGAFARGDRQRVRTIMAGYYLMVAVIVAGFSGLIFIFSEQVIELTLGREFASGAGLMEILIVAQVAASFSTATSSYLLMCGGERAIGVLSLASLAMNVLLNLWLIPLLGAEGAAWTNLATNIFFLVATAVAAVRNRSPKEAT